MLARRATQRSLPSDVRDRQAIVHGAGQISSMQLRLLSEWRRGAAISTVYFVLFLFCGIVAENKYMTKKNSQKKAPLNELWYKQKANTQITTKDTCCYPILLWFAALAYPSHIVRRSLWVTWISIDVQGWEQNDRLRCRHQAMSVSRGEEGEASEEPEEELEELQLPVCRKLRNQTKQDMIIECT